MLKNYIRITLRNLVRYKLYSVINIAGFSIALVPVVLTFLYVAYEFSYDRHNENFDRIYRVVEDGTDYFGRKCLNTVMPNPMAGAIKAEFPEIEYSAAMYLDHGKISYGGEEFQKNDVLVTVPEFFKIFSFKFLRGNSASAFSDPYSICLSESMAYKLFGTKNPMGRTVEFRDVYDLTVTGVYSDIPKNSHFRADFIIPLSLNTGSSAAFMSAAGVSDQNSSWGISMCQIYFLLKKNADISAVDNKYHGLLSKHGCNSDYPAERYFSQPLGDIHLKSDIYSAAGKGEADNIYIYLTIAIIILLIASINYVNLSTARFSQRVKEMSIRKIAGAGRLQLLRQLLIETFVLTFLSLMITILIVLIVLPYFNAFVERDIHISSVLFSGIVFLIIIISISAGLYPAWVISSVRPLSYFRGKTVSLRS